nr:HGGxSTG domain-containing protein [Silicimonas algicola]
MRDSPRCGAKTRRGTPCQAPAVAGKRRCRMHGGAKGSGAPKGNQNALKHGRHTAHSKETRLLIRAFVQRTREIIEEI